MTFKTLNAFLISDFKALTRLKINLVIFSKITMNVINYSLFNFLSKPNHSLWLIQIRVRVDLNALKLLFSQKIYPKG
jgi:hypothetical protein